MRARKKQNRVTSPIRRQILINAGRVMLVIAGASLLATALIVVRLFTAARESQLATETYSEDVGKTPAVSDTTPLPTEALPGALRVGIVAGHAGYDSGAVCPDGLTEAEVTMVVAQEVEALLSRKGYQVDLLEEFDDRLTGYRADALISIHADSCDVPGATGFKIARVTDSAIPQAEDQLVACLYQEYETATGLPRHPSSITDNMTEYHAFREIDYYTPGAIIEMGFLLDDRDFLVHRPKLAARGIAAGVLCFLEEGE